ncbi:hypothetical protein IJ380_00135 [Candidatus Saccharibacteria bacterium]|nr:hypothetical protein [Candidatus Saccharibacteria bacterium]
MPKDIAIGKKLKIDKAQSNMMAAVLGASVVLGMSVVLGVYFLKYIRFNAAIISTKDKAIQGYSDTIKNVGVCRAPKGRTYSDNELNHCEPNEIKVSSLPNTLRENVMVNMASNEDLESVARNGLSVCIDGSTGEKMSYQKLMQKYETSTTEADKAANFEILMMCSALRAIPDALPAAKNDLALMASINKIFKVSGWEPDSMAPGGDATSNIDGLGAIGVNLTLQTNMATTLKILQNMEKSIREININNASVNWSNGGLVVNANAMAYYTEVSGLDEKIVTVKGDGKVVNGPKGTK